MRPRRTLKPLHPDEWGRCRDATRKKGWKKQETLRRAWDFPTENHAQIPFGENPRGTRGIFPLKNIKKIIFFGLWVRKKWSQKRILCWQGTPHLPARTRVLSSKLKSWLPLAGSGSPQRNPLRFGHSSQMPPVNTSAPQRHMPRFFREAAPRAKTPHKGRNL